MFFDPPSVKVTDGMDPPGPVGIPEVLFRKALFRGEVLLDRRYLGVWVTMVDPLRVPSWRVPSGTAKVYAELDHKQVC